MTPLCAPTATHQFLKHVCASRSLFWMLPRIPSLVCGVDLWRTLPVCAAFGLASRTIRSPRSPSVWRREPPSTMLGVEVGSCSTQGETLFTQNHLGLSPPTFPSLHAICFTVLVSPDAIPECTMSFLFLFLLAL